MAYDKDRRNLRQRCGRFLEKHGITRKSGEEFFMLALPNPHERKLLGAEWRETPMIVPLSVHPNEAVVALRARP